MKRLIALAMCAVSWSAAEAADQQAPQTVARLSEDHAALLAKFPALAQIDSAIRSDCAATNEGKAAESAFCGCAATVTMALWRSGADPKMMSRLNGYLKNPTEAGAKSFLQYQGPELYRPICMAAAKG